MTNGVVGPKGGSVLLPVVAAALIDRDGRVLMQERPPGKALAGLWELPGGKVEPDESPEAALVRELDEELGLIVSPAALTPAGFASHPLGERHLLLLLFRCLVWHGEPHGRDGQTLRWCEAADLRALPMPAADRALLAEMAASGA